MASLFLLESQLLRGEKIGKNPDISWPEPQNRSRLHKRISSHDRKYPLRKLQPEESTMKQYLKPVVQFLKKEDGPTAVECALLLGLVIVVCLVAIQGSKQSQIDSRLEPVIVEVSAAK
jgi:pilus assembly protein Flp/PilA